LKAFMTSHDNSPRAARLAPIPLRWLEHAGRCCNGFAKLLLVVLSAVMAVTILLQVFLRYVVKASLPWSEELARYLMVWIGLMGASLAVHEGRHVGVSLLVDRTRGVLRKAVTCIAMCGVLWFLWLMLSEGVRLVLNIWYQRSPAMNIPMVIPYAAIPLGAIFMMVQVLLGLSRLFLGADEAREG
jgi:TRAP-type C4-dicarboxylate transport system permease small subunit